MPKERVTYAPCDVADCEMRVYGRGLCGKHYKELLRRNGGHMPPLTVYCKDCHVLVEGAKPQTKRCRSCQVTADAAAKQRYKDLHPGAPTGRAPSRVVGKPAVSYLNPCGPMHSDVRTLWNSYKMTPERYLARWEMQGKRCAICLRPEPTGRGWQVDHDHDCCSRTSCGRCVRGILCSVCNNLLGRAGDSVATLQRAIGYLEGGR